ncbi:hypothetical protein FOA52_003938 [Chlamydomonas sp. UWO 241]|nr:hypothetical protein FOA52_003938 [Chlamydomonas sp. UWO 241]
MSLLCESQLSPVAHSSANASVSHSTGGSAEQAQQQQQAHQQQAQAQQREADASLFLQLADQLLQHVRQLSHNAVALTAAHFFASAYLPALTSMPSDGQPRQAAMQAHAPLLQALAESLVLRTELQPDAAAVATADGRALLEEARTVRRELSCVLRDVCALVGHAPMLGLLAGMAAQGLGDDCAPHAAFRWPRLECALYAANVVSGSIPTGGTGASRPDVAASLHQLIDACTAGAAHPAGSSKLAGTALTLLGGLAPWLASQVLLLSSVTVPSTAPASSDAMSGTSGAADAAAAATAAATTARMPAILHVVQGCLQASDRPLSRNAATCLQRLCAQDALAHHLLAAHTDWVESLVGVYQERGGMQSCSGPDEDASTEELLLVTLCRLAASLLPVSSLAASAPVPTSALLLHLATPGVHTLARSLGEVRASCEAAAAAGQAAVFDLSCSIALSQACASLEVLATIVGSCRVLSSSLSAELVACVGSSELAGEMCAFMGTSMRTLLSTSLAAAPGRDAPAALTTLAEPLSWALSLAEGLPVFGLSKQQPAELLFAAMEVNPQLQANARAIAAAAGGRTLALLVAATRAACCSDDTEQCKAALDWAQALLTAPFDARGAAHAHARMHEESPGAAAAEDAAAAQLRAMLDGGAAAAVLQALLLAVAGTMPSALTLPASSTLHSVWRGVGDARFGVWLSAALELPPPGTVSAQQQGMQQAQGQQAALPWGGLKPEQRVVLVRDMIDPACAADVPRFKRLVKQLCGGKRKSAQ